MLLLTRTEHDILMQKHSFAVATTVLSLALLKDELLAIKESTSIWRTQSSGVKRVGLTGLWTGRRQGGGLRSGVDRRRRGKLCIRRWPVHANFGGPDFTPRTTSLAVDKAHVELGDALGAPRCLYRRGIYRL